MHWVWTRRERLDKFSERSEKTKEARRRNCLLTEIRKKTGVLEFQKRADRGEAH